MTRRDNGDLFADLESLFGNARVLGFSPLVQELRAWAREAEANKYPPHDIVQVGDDRWYIEFALAGFTPDDITITVQGNVLLVEGKLPAVAQDSTMQYRHRGIARRNFAQEFRLGEHLEVGEAVFQTGMLTIPLTRVVPEEAKPRTVNITEHDPRGDGDPAA